MEFPCSVDPFDMPAVLQNQPKSDKTVFLDNEFGFDFSDDLSLQSDVIFSDVSPSVTG